MKNLRFIAFTPLLILMGYALMGMLVGVPSLYDYSRHETPVVTRADLSAPGVYHRPCENSFSPLSAEERVHANVLFVGRQQSSRAGRHGGDFTPQ